MIKERYCSYEVARLLKEKGFNEPVRSFYLIDDAHSNAVNVTYTITYRSVNRAKAILRPTHQMACDWLGEVYGIYITIVYGDYPSLNKVFWTPQINSLKGFDLPDDFYKDYDEYGEACEAALKYVLENLVLYESMDS